MQPDHCLEKRSCHLSKLPNDAVAPFQTLTRWTGQRVAMKPGRGRFKMAGRSGAVAVWYALPRTLAPRSPILFVLPGVLRNGAEYRDIWAPHAEAAGALLLVPEFPKKAYPGVAGYNLGNMVDAAGSWNDRSRWAFSVIERLFDEASRLIGSERPDYWLYGHSAGAQFVQRFVLFMPEARLGGAVAANAGWHTLPSFEEQFPYGLAGSSISPAELKIALGRKFTIMVGEKDTDANHHRLRTTKQAQRQGRTRRERGHFLLQTAQRTAATMNVALNWRLVTVPGVGHSNKAMMPAAARHLFA